MIVICEKCGKKYRIDPVNIKGKAASFNCHVCSHVIMVIKARVTPPQPDSKMKTTAATATVEQLTADRSDINDITPTTDEINAGTRHRPKAGGLGLRTKMILLFFFIPSLLTAGASFFYLGQIETTSRLLLQESVKIVAQGAEGKTPDQSAATEMIQSRSEALSGKARIIVLVMLGAALLLIGIIVLVYANRLTGKIESLTDVVDRISAGDLEMEIEMKSRDELGELAQAIARMRDNIRLYIERLQQRP
jgi:HAMP domain-containing protein/DNA-directed RNA polymerase subunit RPC12/RpoP